MTGTRMKQALWATIYSLIGLGLAAAAVLLIRGVAKDSEPLALAGIACCIASLTAAHFTFTCHWLNNLRRKVDVDREDVADTKAAVAAREAMLDNRVHVATRDLEKIERDNREALEADRERMLDEVEARSYDLKCEGFRAGFETRTLGLTPDAPSNVVHLPLAAYRPTTMGGGVLSQN